MSDTERLEAAAWALERRAEHLETVVRYSRSAGWRTRWTREAAEARATACVFLAVLRRFKSGNRVPLLVWNATLALADAVLGVPASPKEPGP